MEITITDTATPGIARLLGRLRSAQDREAVHRAAAFGVERLVRRHLRTNYSTRGNALGGKSTGFWKKVIESTEVTADAGAGTMRIKERGAALRYYGGTVRPTRKQWLTVPACAEAHGKRVAEVKGGYAAQVWLFNRAGKPFAIAEKVKVDGQGKQTHGRVLFWLTKKTVHKADKGVLPSVGELEVAAAKGAAAAMRNLK